MMKPLITALLLCSILFIMGAFATPQPPKSKFISMNENDLRASFGIFVNEYDRNYKTVEEYEHRYSIFKANMARVNEYNFQSQRATFGVTPFSDKTDEERQVYLGFNPQMAKGVKRAQVYPSYYDELDAAVDSSEPPLTPHFDFRKEGLTIPVQDQGDCGSCWAMASVGAYASAAKKKGHKYPFDVSVQQLIDCAFESGARGCAGGTPDHVADYLDHLEPSDGLEPDSTYPYTSRTGNVCLHNETNTKIGYNYMWYTLPPCYDPETYEEYDCSKQDGPQALNKTYSLGFVPGVCLYASGAWFDYTGGVFDLPCSSYGGYMNHCVQLVANTPSEKTVTIQNSWNKKWGENGSMRLLIDFEHEDFKNQCGVFNMMYHFGIQNPR